MLSEAEASGRGLSTDVLRTTRFFTAAQNGESWLTAES
jgi:hypothetical protein